MAEITITGFPIPFGIKSPNKMYSADVYAGPYDSVQDALDTVVAGIRTIGRPVGIKRADGKGVDEYRFEKDGAGNWILVFKASTEIPIDGSYFRHIKGVTANALNTGNGIETNDIASNGLYMHPDLGFWVKGDLICIDSSGNLETGIGTKWQVFGNFQKIN